jgi:hypothetical protein
VSTPNNGQLRPAFDTSTAIEALFDQWLTIQSAGKGYVHIIARGDIRVASIGAEDTYDKIEQVVEMVRKRNDEGHNLYVTPNPMSTRDKRGKDHVVAFIEGYVDVDCGKLGINTNAVIDRALSFDVKPSLALMSGNGVQLRYRVLCETRQEWQSTR